MALSLGIRPSELVEFHGSVLERLLFDARVLAEVTKHSGTQKGTVLDKIMARRQSSGLYTS